MQMLHDLGANLALGFHVAMTPSNLFYCFVGVFVGNLVGVLPGLGGLTAISLLLPLTFHIDSVSSIVMLAGVYYGSTYGGSTVAILLNLPGEPASAVICVDGYPMSRQNRGGIALVMVTVASFFGAAVGILLMVFCSPLIAKFALDFGAEEYFAMMLFGLVAASMMSSGAPAKGVAMVALGVLFGLVGADVQSDTVRFTFGIRQLYDGLSLITIAVGLFGVAEIISSMRTSDQKHFDRKDITFRSMIPTRDDVRRSWMPMVRGSAIGSFCGALPGVGPTIASFLAYATEKKVARDRSRFGRGAIEGVVAPEAASNSAHQTAFIPTMVLGIPGTVTMALIVGALVIQGITPGPLLMTQRPDLFWGLVMSFWIGNVILVILHIPLIGLWIRILAVPYHLLYPTVLMLVCIGAYSARYDPVDVIAVMVFGAIGYGMKLLDFHPAPLLLGFVLGPLIEENFQRALNISEGDFSVFLQKPISAGFIVATALVVVWSFSTPLRRRLRPGRRTAA